MADAQKEVKIRIVSEVDPAPVRQQAAALEEVGNTGKKAEEKVNEATKETNKSRREAREIIGHLGREFPGVAELLRVGFSGVTGAILLGVKAVASFLEQIQELGSRSTPEFQQLTEAVKSQKKAIEDAEQEARSYARALEAIKNATETIQAASAAAQKAAAEKTGRDTTVIDKTHAAQTAQIDAAERASVISHEQALIAKFKLDEEYAAKKLKLEQELQARILVLKRLEVANAQIEAAELQKKVDAESAASGHATGAAARAAKTTPRDEAALKAEEDKLRELEKEQEDLSGFHPFKSEILLRQQRAQNQTEIDATENTIASLKRRIQQDDAKEISTKDAADSAKAALDTDKARLTKDEETIAQAKRDLPREQAKYDADQAAAKTGVAIDTAARIQTLPAAAQIQAAAQIEQQIQLHKNVSDAQKQLHDQVFASLTAILGSAQKTSNLLLTITGSLTTLAQKNAALERAIGYLQAQMRQTNNIGMP